MYKHVPNITVNKGVLSCVNGQPALLVLTNAKLPSAFFTNHAQPEPKVVTAHLVNSSLNFAKEPNVALIASLIRPLVRHRHLSQLFNKSLIQTCAALLKMGPEILR